MERSTKAVLSRSYYFWNVSYYGEQKRFALGRPLKIAICSEVWLVVVVKSYNNAIIKMILNHFHIKILTGLVT